MVKRNQRLRFIFNELGLYVPGKQIARALANHIDDKVALKRFYPGHGWGLKYLAFKADKKIPFAVIKASSRLIERRLKVALAEKYTDPARRFALEADVLCRLAELSLGPEVLLCREYFFVREYLEGVALSQLPPADIALSLPTVLASIERACASGVFHTDLNAGNVIVRPGGQVGFIDCEIPGSINCVESSGEKYRTYCHERLLHSLAGLAGTDALLTDTAVRYYECADGLPINAARVRKLLSGENIRIEAPQ